MYSPESKKLALTRIKEIFETYSDFEHPLTQNDIAEHLDHDYGINIDRKTIGRNISLLKETGIEIESDHRGSYLGSRLLRTPSFVCSSTAFCAANISPPSTLKI